MTLSDTCVNIELEAGQYDKYEVPGYEPLGATQFLHSVPRITSTNFSNFENEFDEAHYLLGVFGVVVSVLVIALLVLFRQAWAWRRCWQSTRNPTTGADHEALSSLQEGVSSCQTNCQETGSVLQTTCSPLLSTGSATAHFALISGGYFVVLLGLLGVLTCCVSLSAINTGYDDGTAAAAELDSRFSIFVAGLHELDDILHQNWDALAAVENNCPKSLLEVSFLRPVSKKLLALKEAMDGSLTVADHIARQLSKGTSAMPHTSLVVIVLGLFLVVDFAVLFVLGTRAFVLAIECSSDEEGQATLPEWCGYVKDFSESQAGSLLQVGARH
ncbi:hypothetical protein CYMTET_56439 [Cymbomonas tetramitiformis]|uniref:Transmembrane protein n=1 Tax=Cymbomonas tetramitiformis TaxID=36881 RepID=A0AAE0BCP0_9CHLO|nr:hypothetical protein CYMTET_56439 [Cymbomonas tetramitiformis]